MTDRDAMNACKHDIVVLCFKEGWFCLDCQRLVDHQCGYRDDYHYGITGYRIGSKVGQKESLKYARSER